MAFIGKPIPWPDGILSRDRRNSSPGYCKFASAGTHTFGYIRFDARCKRFDPTRTLFWRSRNVWVKSKCLNREEFVAVGWTDTEGSQSHIGALLLGYYTEDGRLHYAGRAGTGMTDKGVKRLLGVLAALQVAKMPLTEPPPRDSRFGSPSETVQSALGAAGDGC